MIEKEYTGTFWKSDCVIVWVVVIRVHGVKTKESGYDWNALLYVNWTSVRR